MAESVQRNVLGVLGGMGPLASAEFLKTIYEYSLGEHEQDSPIVVVFSDPTFPDRTDSFLRRNDDVLLKRLIEALRRLCEFGASKIVICCITLHYLLPRLPNDLRKQIISLVDVIFANVLQTQKGHLLVCTSGTQKLGIFQSHQQWMFAKDYLILPDENDQYLIHKLIYERTKRNGDIRELKQLIELLLSKYQVDAFVAGCTEIHLLAKHFSSSSGNRKGYGCVDPLTIIAKGMTEGKI